MFLSSDNSVAIEVEGSTADVEDFIVEVEHSIIEIEVGCFSGFFWPCFFLLLLVIFVCCLSESIIIRTKLIQNIDTNLIQNDFKLKYKVAKPTRTGIELILNILFLCIEIMKFLENICHFDNILS